MNTQKDLDILAANVTKAMQKPDNEPDRISKETIAEYAAQLSDYDHWFYQPDDDTYNLSGGSLQDAIDCINKAHKISTFAKEYLEELGLE